MALHRAHSPATEGGVADPIYRQAAQAVAASTTAADVRVIALGSGGSWKDEVLVRALLSAGKMVSFVAIDASPYLASHSAEKIRALGVKDTLSIAADLLSCADALNDLAGHLPTILTAYGLLPNFEPAEFFAFLRAVTRPQDTLLVSANLLPSDVPASNAMQRILPQYKNSQLQDWVGGVLHDWGLNDFVENYQMAPRPVNDLWRFEAQVRWKTDQPLDWEGQPLHVHKDSPLRLFFSYRYTPEQFTAHTQAHKLQVQTSWLASNAEEGVFALLPNPITQVA
jgi:uncharacterized SAM-dependent methyltransferase